MTAPDGLLRDAGGARPTSDACNLAIIDDCDAALAELEAANPTR